MIKDSDRQLWSMFISGDDDAMHQLYKLYIDALYDFGLRFTQDADLIKDAIQDLFIDLHKYRFTVAGDVNVKSYLFTSLKRKVLYTLKKRSREDHALETPFFLSAEEEQDHEEEYSEMHGKLMKQLDLLPGRQKEVLYLRYNSELEYEEIAEIMNISTATCRTLVYRGVKQLRERMVVKHVYKYLATFFIFFNFFSL